MEALAISLLPWILSVFFGIVAYLLKRQVQAAEDKMTATILDLNQVKHKVHSLEVQLPQTYATRLELQQMRTEIMNSFQEVNRDLKTILRSLGVKDAA